MANTKVSVYKQVRIGNKWVKCPPAINPKNKKPENDWVLVKGVREHHPEGDWGLFYYEGGKRVWKTVGPKYESARYEAQLKQIALTAKAAGHAVVEAGSEGKTPVGPALEKYIEDFKLARREKSAKLVEHDLNEFFEWSKVEFIEDITRTMLLKYKQHIVSSPKKPREVKPHKTVKNRSDRTAANKVARVNRFHASHMNLAPGKGLITKRDIKTVAPDVTIYTEDELKAFFDHCKSTAQRLMFEVFLKSGLRRSELEFLEWADVDFDHSTLKVREKFETATRPYSFSPKTWERREVAIPRDLLEKLREHKKSAVGALVFPTRTGKHNLRIWDECVAVGKRAGIGKAFVHKFRATFASTLLQRGLDLKSVQTLLGHKDLASTQRYLAALNRKTMVERVDAIWAEEKPQESSSSSEERDFEEELRELEM